MYTNGMGDPSALKRKRGRPPKNPTVCPTCNLDPVRVHGECRNCANYRKNNGKPRPEALISRLRRERWHMQGVTPWRSNRNGASHRDA